MIGIVTYSAHAKCANCGGRINRGRADFERYEDWSHEDNGRPECPGAPRATPLAGTITKVDR